MLLFEDEQRNYVPLSFGRISEPSYCWVFGKERPIVPCVRVRLHRYAFGSVEPETGDFFYEFYDKCNTEIYNDYLAKLSKKYSNSLMLLIGDGAQTNEVRYRHTSKTLILPENIRFFRLPPRTPEMNPTEQCWREKGNTIRGFNMQCKWGKDEYEYAFVLKTDTAMPRSSQ